MRTKRWREREEKARNFGPTTLRGPTLRGPPLRAGLAKVGQLRLAKVGLAKVGQLRLAKVGQIFLAKVGLAKVGIGQSRPIRMAKVGLAKVGIGQSRPIRMAKVGLAKVGLSRLNLVQTATWKTKIAHTHCSRDGNACPGQNKRLAEVEAVQRNGTGREDDEWRRTVNRRLRQGFLKVL